MDLSAQGTDPEETVVVKEHKRTRKKKSVRDDLYALLPIRDIKCDVPESERFCPDCDAPMEHLGYKTVREELRITPAKVERVRYLQETLVCPVCREGDDTTIRATKTPAALAQRKRPVHTSDKPDNGHDNAHDRDAPAFMYFCDHQQINWSGKQSTPGGHEKGQHRVGSKKDASYHDEYEQKRSKNSRCY